MGADFIFVTLDWPKGKTAKGTEKNRKSVITAIKKAIDEMEIDPDNLPEAFQWYDWPEIEDDMVASIKQQLYEDLDEIDAATQNELREAATMDFKDDVILITGGMSWGDGPTDLYGTICKFYELGLI